MAILATLLAFGSRFAGKILTTALGWASTLLFGRVPADRQKLVLGITFGSVIWMVLLAGVVFPAIGTFLLVLVPQQDIIPEWIIRLAMLAGALIVPAVVGALTLILAGPTQRTPRGIVGAVARGYPLTALLAVLLVFLAGLSIWRKANSLRRGWVDAHVPIVVNAGAYEQVADDLARAITAAGLEVTPVAASAAMSRPARWLAAVAGPGSGSLVPDRLLQLDGAELDILIYPMDLLISGKPELVSRARAAMASRLTSSAAHMTVSAESQAVEDRLTALARPHDVDADALDRTPRYDDAAEVEFRAIDEILASSPIPYEEWEVLYRQRLQVERDLRAGAMAGDSVLGAAPVGDGEAEASRFPDVGAALATAGRWARTGATVVLAAAADDRTGQLIDRAAGPQWRWAARAASVAAVAARAALGNEPGATTDRRPGPAVGEPASFPESPPSETVSPPGHSG